MKTFTTWLMWILICCDCLFQTYTIQGTPKDGGVLPRSLDVLFNSIEGKHYHRMNLKPRFCTDVTRLTDDEEHRENNYKSALLSSLDKEVCVNCCKYHFLFIWFVHNLISQFLYARGIKWQDPISIFYKGLQGGWLVPPLLLTSNPHLKGLRIVSRWASHPWAIQHGWTSQGTHLFWAFQY